MAQILLFRQSGVRIGNTQAVTNAKLPRGIQYRLAVVDKQRFVRLKASFLRHGAPQTLILFRITKCVGGK